MVDHKMYAKVIIKVKLIHGTRFLTGLFLVPVSDWLLMLLGGDFANGWGSGSESRSTGGTAGVGTSGWVFIGVFHGEEKKRRVWTLHFFMEVLLF